MWMTELKTAKLVCPSALIVPRRFTPLNPDKALKKLRRGILGISARSAASRWRFIVRF
jgi:hypothetical protein